MDLQIGTKEIQQFRESYQKDKTNKLIENAITKNGIDNVCLNREAIKRNPFVFTIELEDTRRYNQKPSSRCWIYAGINMIKREVAKELNIDEKKLELSINYIAFYDKLEKSNTVYENVIAMKDHSEQNLKKENVIRLCMSEGGRWEFFREIVKKYGITPETAMPETYNSKESKVLGKLLKQKVKQDVHTLIQMKKDKASMKDIRIKKQEMLEQMYGILSKTLGEPPRTFNYEYKTKEGKITKLENITPLKFKETYLKLELDNYIQLGNVKMYHNEFNKKYKKKYAGNVYETSSVEFLNLPVNELKKATILQLKEGSPVYFIAETKKGRDAENNILDSDIYDYETALGIKNMPKEEALNYYDIDIQHVMVFTGVNLNGEKPERWKVEDSYGTKDTKLNGYYVMNDNFFEDFIFFVVVHKKHLTENQRKLWEQEAISYEMDEPF